MIMYIVCLTLFLRFLVFVIDPQPRHNKAVLGMVDVDIACFRHVSKHIQRHPRL